jgi:hypothetical protein
MILNEDIARPTRNRYANHDFEFESQEMVGMMDDTWGKYYLLEKGAGA